MKKIIIPAVLLVLSTEAFSAEKIRCPRPSAVAPAHVVISDYDEYFAENKIIPVTPLTVSATQQFHFEFIKFPASLHNEIIASGGKIHIMEGGGVTTDPSWHTGHEKTFDGRDWSLVPGAGGSTAKGLTKAPTRIVNNKLYRNHSTVNLFLHEHAHTMDSIRNPLGISHSQKWADILASEPNSMKFLDEVCGSYCTENLEEGFAELFANYHACQAAQDQMKAEVPKLAEFFQSFNSTKVFGENGADIKQEKPRRRGFFRRIRNILGQDKPEQE